MIRDSINLAWDRWANLHPLLRFLIAAVVLALFALFGGKPAYHAFKAWRLERNLVAAQKAVKEVRMDEARDLSLTVLRAGDPRIEAFRILEKSTASLRDPRHGDIARALMFHPEGSDEDRLNGFRGIVTEAPLGLLGQAWASLPSGCQQDPRFAVVFADRLLAERRINEAASVLLGVPEAKRGLEVERSLARVLIGSGAKQGYDEAQRMIAKRIGGGGGEISGWLDVLEEIPAVSLQPSLLGPVREALMHPASGAKPARAALMIARMDYAANFSRGGAVIDGAVSRWKDSDPEAVADFLADLGFYQRLLETFPPENLKEHPELFPKMLEAMERTGAWEKVPPLLDEHGHLLPKFEELAHRAVAAAKSGDSTLRVQTWNAAMGEAKSDPQFMGFLKLHRMAMIWDMRDEADQALVEAIRLGRGPLPLYADLRPLLGSLSRQGRESTLLEICAIYFSLEPGNPVLLTQYAYLACLNNLAEPKLVIKALEPLAKAFPKELPIQFVLATAYLCNGDAAKAAETMDPLKPEPEKLAPGYRAAFLATQVLNGRMSKDDPRVTKFPWKSLQVSEHRKFSELIASAER
jgi:hypothetical protein